MKTTLCLTSFLAAVLTSPVSAQSPPAPAPSPAGEMIRETRTKVLNRELEKSLAEKLEMEKQLLLAPADQQEALKTRVAALANLIGGLERDLQQLAPSPPGTPSAQKPATEALQNSARTQIAKLHMWREQKNSGLRATITKLRETAADNLKQQAASADPAASTALLAQARWLATIQPETLLSHTQEMRSLAGTWEQGLAPYRKSSFTPNGLIVQLDGTPHGTWTWLDESQGLFFVDDIPSKWMNICRIVDAEKIQSVVIDGSQFKYTRKSPSSVAPPPSGEGMTKLAAAEQSLRDLAALEWQQETQKALTALQSTLQELPERERGEFAQTIKWLQGEKCFEPKTDPTSGLAGKWVLEGRTLEFTPGGVVLVNGEKKGKWLWGKSRSKGVIVFTLGAGQLTALGNLGGDSMGLQVIGEGPKHAMKLSSR